MFTGIVEATGRVSSRSPIADGARVRVDTQAWNIADVTIGDSIAVSGCCLTVVDVHADALDFDVSGETLRCTTGFDVGRRVNLEKALRLADRLGGHLMSGHVDGVGTVIAMVAVAGAADGSWRLDIDAPAGLARFIARKGSIAVDGVSLTTNGVDGSVFTVNVIPHTRVVTTFGQLAAGDAVNLEVDLVARYVQRLLDR
jgi:riboflavin synthase